MSIVDIWKLSLTESNYTNTECLSTLEKNRAQNFFKEEDRENYISSHVFLREVLSHYFPKIKPAEWCFDLNAYSKPSIVPNHGVKLHFNLSHTHSYAYVICSKESECGIDIEEIKEMDLSPELLDLVMSKEEKKEFSDSKEELFFRYWTLKEAHVKALGKGLSIALSTVEFKNLKTLPLNFKIKNIQYYSALIEDNYYLSFAIVNTDNIETSFYTKEDL